MPPSSASSARPRPMPRRCRRRRSDARQPRDGSFLVAHVDADELPGVVLANELQVVADTARLVLEPALQSEDAVVDLGFAAGADFVGDDAFDVDLLVAKLLEGFRELLDRKLLAE